MEPSTPNAPSGPASPEAAQPNPASVETAPSTEVAAPTAPEKAPSAPEVDRPAGESANQNQGMTLPPVAPVQDQTPVAAPPTQDPAQDDNQRLAKVKAPDAANDVDVIEKEWVDKAKEIVKQSVDDPHKQNHDVSLLKADYMRKRYGKEVKLPKEEAA